ncbi:CHAP domain-containing protein [Rhodopila sp.]|uniref:CHAP domain-containing protein n=1 Tax=Rhodopila sp. TaxID=2480087 RepID=UPI003D0EC6F7
MLCSPLTSLQAQANPTQQNNASPAASTRAIGPRYAGKSQLFAYVHGKRGSTRSYAISCVPYARQVSGIEVVGDAWTWWKKAAGAYARGDRPEAGSVLAFRANGRMHLGHVAVVKQIVNAREVIVDHANWSNGGGRGEVSHNVAVVDVSEANNWSAVRVQLANRRDFGSIYPTYGFIYNRPDDGAVTLSIDRPAPQPDINPVPSDLRPVAERPWHTVEEVAEAPDAEPRQIDLRVSRQTALGR